MDLLTYALAKKQASSGGGSVEPIIPTIGENGNWFIRGVDTGFKAVANNNVEVDGILKADATNQNLTIIKDGIETVVGEVTQPIHITAINNLFN